MNKKSNKLLSNNGQAMVETLISTVFLAILVIASIQLVIMVVNDLIANEAAYSISRVAVVSKDNDLNNKTRIAATYLLTWNTNSRFIPNGAPVIEPMNIQAAHNGARRKQTKPNEQTNKQTH